MPSWRFNDAIPKGFDRIAKLIGARVQVIPGSDRVGTIARPELADAIEAFILKPQLAPRIRIPLATCQNTCVSRLPGS